MRTRIRRMSGLGALLASALVASGAITPAAAGPSAPSPVSCRTVRTDARLAKAHYATPADKQVTRQLGPVVMTTYSPVSMNEYVNRTNIYFTFTNNGPTPVTVRLLDWQRLQAEKPGFVMFVRSFSLNDVPRENVVPLEVPAGQTRTMELYISKELSFMVTDPRNTPDRAQATTNFTFDVAGTNDRVTVPITFAAYDRYGPDTNFHLQRSARVQGKVTDSAGRPVAGAQVSITPQTGNLGLVDVTGKDGTYSIDILSTPGLKELHGSRPIGDSWDYALSIEKAGKSLGYRGGLSFRQGEVKACNTKLASAPQVSYQLVGETKTDGPEGFWELAFFGGGDRIVGLKAGHDPYLGPAYVLAVDLRGNELWRYPTGGRCWGLDVSPDGQLIGVTCQDGMLRVLNASGQLVYSEAVGSDANANPHTVAFSPDGTSMLADVFIPNRGGGIQVLDTRTWSKRWTDLTMNAYHAYWTNTASQLVVGGSDGAVRSYTGDGQIRWQRSIGYVPLFLSIDTSGRVVSGGKTHDLFAWDANGTPLWRFAAANTVMRHSPGRGASEDGSFILMAAFNFGELQALDANGRLLWQRYLPRARTSMPGVEGQLRFQGPGHNATYVAPDGSFALAGSWANQWVRYDRAGASQYISPTYPIRPGYPTWKDGRALQPAVQTLIASPDGKVVAAGFSDSTIRIYRQK